VDETLEPLFQTLDQFCFSSQFWFACSLSAYGTLCVVLGMTMLLRHDYDPFADPLFPLLVGLVIFTTVVACRVAVRLASVLQLWAVDSHSSDPASRPTTTTAADDLALQAFHNPKRLRKLSQLATRIQGRAGRQIIRCTTL